MVAKSETITSPKHIAVKLASGYSIETFFTALEWLNPARYATPRRECWLNMSQTLPILPHSQTR